MKQSWLKPIAYPLLASLLVINMPVQAAVMDTDAALNQTIMSTQRQQQQQEIARFMTREDVQQQLQHMGVTPEQALARVSALSDTELTQLHDKLPTATAGGDIVGALVFVFVLLLVTDILGLTKVFPFTRSIHHR